MFQLLFKPILWVCGKQECRNCPWKRDLNAGFSFPTRSMSLKGSFLAAASSGPVNPLLINARRNSFNEEVVESSDQCFGYCPGAGARWVWHRSQRLLLLGECLLQSLPAVGWKEENCFSFCKHCLVNVLQHINCFGQAHRREASFWIPVGHQQKPWQDCNTSGHGQRQNLE